MSPIFSVPPADESRLTEPPIEPERRANPGGFAIVIDPPQTAIGQLLRPARRGVAGMESHDRMDLTMRP